MSETLQNNTTRTPSKAKNVAFWTLQVLLALTFLAAGAGKLSGNADVVKMFTEIGMGQWLRFTTGVVEIAGAVLLLVPRRAGLGAALLAIVMGGAALTCLFIVEGQSPVPAAALLVLSALTAWGRRDRGLMFSSTQ
ncbi:DoxX family protein [Streptomyces hydrogenans]|uniref:DoxX family protein n=1 Tax=Streptomyces hydrogenans TaxID=1873719 RepID=UPI0035DFCC59